MSSKKVKLNKELYLRAEEKAARVNKSVEEFIEAAVETALSATGNDDSASYKEGDEEMVKKRLADLGYL